MNSPKDGFRARNSPHYGLFPRWPNLGFGVRLRGCGMPVTLKYPSRCGECGGRMNVGDAYIPSTTSSGQWVVSHPGECPTSTPTKLRPARQEINHDELFVVRKCSREPVAYDPDVRWERKHMRVCGQVTSFRKGESIPSCCPYCDAAWARDEAWAA